MDTDEKKLSKTESKRKPRSEKSLCTFPKCGPVKALKEHVKKLAEENARLQQQLADRDARIEKLEAQLRNLRGDLFGASSEKSQPENLHLATKDGVTVEPPSDSADSSCAFPKKEKKKRGAQKGHRGHGRQIPKDLPLTEVIHEIPPEQKVCPHCGKPYRDLNLTEDSIEIDYEVGVILKKHVRRKAAKTCECLGPAIITAPKPPQLIPKGLFSLDFLVFTIVQKYFFQIPLNRQIRQWELEGLDIHAGTLTGCFQTIGAFLVPLYALLIETSRSETHWHVDETRWMVFAEKEGKQGYRWWLWTFVSKRATVFVLDPHRSKEVPQKFFGQTARGIINVDRYGAYCVLDGQMLRQLCWLHVRRDFIRAKEGLLSLRDWADDWIDDIHTLMAVNDKRVACQNHPVQFAEKQAELEGQLEKMAAKRDAQQTLTTNKPVQTKILKSLSRNWAHLTVFVDHADIPMHNNVAESALRGAAVGRNNYYGNHSERGGQFAAMSLSILQSAVQNGLNPQAYLLYYLEACARLGKAPQKPEEFASFLPWNITGPDREALLLKKGKSP
ncbi:Transposase IS66 family [Acididesulfobacillus acetoxydans]|uniref:Transposase IS66 family n=1 Tax=Acididesulfobacillus acetoxydans TaxID=1561005 RepID=A0A8S0XDC5_9FIRM|nr:IS66 family transposase [Acididesulfobacillus acetoxydans]CAA7603376.1 Transposase IS66 family [Acididesulfobacillus acetoxydans]